MTDQQKSSKRMNIILWIAQIILAILFVMGALMKFMPIEKISTMMPWTGQISPFIVRLLGIIDLLGATGLILPSLLATKTKLTFWAVCGIILLMICAIIFHVLRGEASVIGMNVFCIVLAGFVGWGRFGMEK